MTTYTFTHVSRSLTIESSALYLLGDNLVARDLVLARVNIEGRTSTKTYGLTSRNLFLANVPHTARNSSPTFTHASRELIIERSVLNGIVTGTGIFPEIVPSQVQFTPPRHIITEHLAQSGETELHLWADSSAEASLQLDYSNISDTTAETVLSLWDSLYGTFKILRIPRNVLSGVKQELAEYMLRGGDKANWFFAEVPKWEGRIKGYGDLKVNLVAKISTVTTAQGSGSRIQRNYFEHASRNLVIDKSTLSGGKVPLLIAWWDASDLAARTVVSGNVSQLVDKSGNGWNLSQGDASLRPALVTSSINGLDAMEWPSAGGNGFGSGGNAKRLFTSRSDAFVAGEIYAVVKFTASTLDGIPGLIGPNNQGSHPWIAAQGSNSFYTHIFNQFFLNGGSSDQNGNLLPTMASTCLVRANLSSGGTVSTTSGVSLGMDRDYGNLGRGWRGFICEMRVFSEPLGTDDRSALISTLRTKWGFP